MRRICVKIRLYAERIRIFLAGGVGSPTNTDSRPDTNFELQFTIPDPIWFDHNSCPVLLDCSDSPDFTCCAI